MARYNFKETEAKWQAIWEQKGSFVVSEEVDCPKYYVLEMFPYPSGRIHMGAQAVDLLGDQANPFADPGRGDGGIGQPVVIRGLLGPGEKGMSRLQQHILHVERHRAEEHHDQQPTRIAAAGEIAPCVRKFRLWFCTLGLGHRLDLFLLPQRNHVQNDGHHRRPLHHPLRRKVTGRR